MDASSLNVAFDWEDRRRRLRRSEFPTMIRGNTRYWGHKMRGLSRFLCRSTSRSSERRDRIACKCIVGKTNVSMGARALQWSFMSVEITKRSCSSAYPNSIHRLIRRRTECATMKCSFASPQPVRRPESISYKLPSTPLSLPCLLHHLRLFVQQTRQL